MRILLHDMYDTFYKDDARSPKKYVICTGLHSPNICRHRIQTHQLFTVLRVYICTYVWFHMKAQRA